MQDLSVDNGFSLGEAAELGRELLQEMGLDYGGAAMQTDPIIRK